MSSPTTKQEFSPWRARLWPIYSYEIKKFLPLGLIMFCLLFNYTLLRDTKDTLVVNSAGAGAISFLKLYCVTPAAILFVILYAKLTNVFSKEKLFYVVVTPFLVFFGLFGFVMYPNLQALHPTAESLKVLYDTYPRLSGFIDLYAYWAYSLFYVLSEIWGSAMISLLFWQFANQVTRMSESKRFYALFGVIGNVGLILSGQVVVFSSEGIKRFISPGTDAWQVSLYLLMGAVVVIGAVAMMLFRWMHTNVLNNPLYYDEAEQSNKPKKKKPKLSMAESAKLIFTSPELGLIAILVIAYGVTVNLVEVQWKNQLGLYFSGDKGGYNAFMGNYSTITGAVVVFFTLFFGSDMLRRFSWFTSAVITPAIILIGGVTFFLFIFAKDLLDPILQSLPMMQTSSLSMAAFLGAGIIIASKAVKYCLFDPTKEMAYIPLDDELKSKGKAAVDVIGARAGKSGGAFVQSSLGIFLATKDVIAIAPYTFAIFAVGCGLWILADKVLSGKIVAAQARKDAEKAREVQSSAT
jgi:AAA family ATP:ADP antiporter